MDDPVARDTDGARRIITTIGSTVSASTRTLCCSCGHVWVKRSEAQRYNVPSRSETLQKLAPGGWRDAPEPAAKPGRRT
ncbi:hypothetical protein [Rhodanobacter soli]|uniref:Uncharacterized protein n=1 Tax=Rhodanobacter soli TaxID=590609 RepID=A0ABV2PV03_9GAMM